MAERRGLHRAHGTGAPANRLVERPFEPGMVSPKPREGWAKAFRNSKSRTDELVEARQARNKFDEEEWKW